MSEPAVFPLSADAITRVLCEGDPKAAPHAVTVGHARPFAEAIVAFAPFFGVTTRLRLGHFLAQCIVEGAWLRATEEYASGAAYDTGALAKRLGNTPARDGDGQRYKGHGRIQTTGKTNHERATAGLRRIFPKGVPWRGQMLPVPDFVADPKALTREPWATLAAFWWWHDNGANAEADRGDHAEQVRRISRGVNRGNYAADRRANAEGERIESFQGVMAQLRREGL